MFNTKTNLLFGIHCHQPIDNFDEVIFNAIEKSYKPFFEILKEFPSFKCCVHFSGWLLEFIEKKDNKLFKLMQELSPQLEFFSGGYYEPILASIPSKDRIGQIKKLNKYIKKSFNQQPKGLWLTERVWDNSIIKDLKKCKIEYVIVDDYHFIASGYDENNLDGYFLSEEGGEKIALFPISQSLRYAIPFYQNSEVNKIIKSKKTSIIFDDGEKFGIWPKTYESVYEKGWLREFFTNSTEDKEIEIQTFYEYYKSHKPIALAYLPSVSYFEMGEWSLKAHDAKRLEQLNHSIDDGSKFLKGGIWKNFLTKYQESNWIQKRFLELSKKQKKSKKFKNALYKAECNDVLWHGVFGGIYLPNLRDNAYTYLIECEKILYKKERVEILDIDFDGSDEYKFHTKELLTIISAKSGAQIFELDLKSCNFNLQNTLTRYEEAYHSKIQKVDKKAQTKESKELKTIHNNRLEIDKNVSINYDWYLKKSVIDHISDESLTIDTFKNCSFKEYGDFTNQPFEILSKDKNSITFYKNGGIYDKQKEKTSISKIYNFKKNKIELKIKLNTTYPQNLNYFSEWNLHFPNIKNITINEKTLEDNLSFFSDKLIIIDNILNKKLEFKFPKKIKILTYTLNTLSQNEEGVDLTTQGISFGFVVTFRENLEFNYSFVSV